MTSASVSSEFGKDAAKRIRGAHSGFALSLALLDLVNVAVELVGIGSPVMARQFIERRVEDLADTLELARTHRRLDGCDARIG